MHIFSRNFLLFIFFVLSSFSFSAYAQPEQKTIFISVPSAKNPAQAQSIHLIKTYFEALNKKDMDKFFSIMSSDVVHDLNQDGVEKGIDKFKIFMKSLNDSFDDQLSHIIILVSDDGKYAAARWIDYGTYFKDEPGFDIKAMNQKYIITGGHFFEIKDNKITHVTTYYNSSDFIKQIKQ